MLDTQTRMGAWYRDTSHPKTLQRMHTQTFVYERIKRVFDIVLAAVLLLILSPLLLVLALAIRLDSPGPVLFVQRRTGRYGRPFNFFKFRSMSYSLQHMEVHRQYVRQYANGDGDAEAPNGVHKPLNSGLVITRVGKVLRQTSLDELPQLWNILRGDMSFVGPRAWADYELENYKDWHFRRLEVPPGLTGLAQINGRSALGFDEIIRLDIEYIDRRTIWLDLEIMLKTIPVVLTGKDTG